MNVSSKFYHFSFAPIKLMNERIQIEKKFSTIDKEIISDRGKKKLPELLEIIRKTPLVDIESILSNFSKLDIRIIMYEYPFSKEKDEDQLKINYILTALYRSEFGKIIWKLFQEDFSNEYLQSLLKSSYSKDREKFAGMTEEVSINFGRAILNETGIIEGLIETTLTSSQSMLKVFEQWKVVKESSLERKLIGEILIKGISSNEIIQREGINNIIEYLNKLPLKTYQLIISNYIEARDFKSFDRLILTHAIKVLKNPEEDDNLWGFISEDSLKKVQKWLLQAKLKEFFDNDLSSARFDYWKRFIDYIEDVGQLKDPLVAFIYFNDFVVVEFGKIGAAYFYYKDGFEEIISPRTKLSNFKYGGTAKKERMLKDTSADYQGINLFITKLHHNINWQRRFDVSMHKYLNGQFK